jgi:hypothetical protein
MAEDNKEVSEDNKEVGEDNKEADEDNKVVENIDSNDMYDDNEMDTRDHHPAGVFNDNTTKCMVAALDTISLAPPFAVTEAAAQFEMHPIPLIDDPPADQPLMGSSRTSGGLFRGRAPGNVPNHADFATTTPQLVRSTKGEVYLYMTDQYPRHISFESMKGDSEMVVMVEVVESMTPILERVARKFSIIKSECAFNIFNSLNLKLN